MVVSIPSFLPDHSWFHHLVGNVPGTEWLGYRGWEGTKALLSYLILPFTNHPCDQEKRLGVESVRCKEQISKPYTFTWKFLVHRPYSSPRLEGTCGSSTFLSSNEINLIKWARRATNRNMYYLLTCSHRDLFIACLIPQRIWGGMTSFSKVQIKLFLMVIILTQKRIQKTWDKIEEAIATNMSTDPT